jgi:uncharacterized SAM-binding protein YcdF (DUF218 family)
LRVLLAFLLALVVIIAAGALVFLNLGRWLVVQDPLAPARAIVPLSGRMPARAVEAARLYRQHLAPEVWLTHPQGAQQALAPYGISYVGEQQYNREVLEKLGVPASSIRILEPRIANTADEIRVIANELDRVDGQRVILVTSPPHTRRVKTIWLKLVGNNPEAIVRHTRASPFEADRWWSNTEDSLDVLRETLGLVNAWAGFPLHPPRRPSRAAGGVPAR